MFIEVTLFIPNQELTQEALVNLNEIELITIREGYVQLMGSPKKGSFKVANSYADIKRKIAQGGVKE